MDLKTAHINEIFSSIQGEGPYIGYRQIFVRFVGCNMRCRYCDTAHEQQSETLNSDELAKKIRNMNNPPYHSLSLTGGEPLLRADFLYEFLPKLADVRVYLETNGTLPDELSKVIKYTDIISMDIKLESSTGYPMPFGEHKEFINVAINAGKELFIKVITGNNITKDEISAVKELVKPGIPLILQLLDNEADSNIIMSVQEEFLGSINDVRVIPQVHKYMGLR